MPPGAPVRGLREANYVHEKSARRHGLARRLGDSCEVKRRIKSRPYPLVILGNISARDQTTDVAIKIKIIANLDQFGRSKRLVHRRNWCYRMEAQDIEHLYRRS